MAKFKNDKEEKVYMDALKAAYKNKDLTSKERMKVAEKALAAYRSDTEEKAKSVRDLMSERHKKMKDET